MTNNDQTIAQKILENKFFETDTVFASTVSDELPAFKATNEKAIAKLQEWNKHLSKLPDKFKPSFFQHFDLIDFEHPDFMQYVQQHIDEQAIKDIDLCLSDKSGWLLTQLDNKNLFCNTYGKALQHYPRHFIRFVTSSQLREKLRGQKPVKNVAPHSNDVKVNSFSIFSRFNTDLDAEVQRIQGAINKLQKIKCKLLCDNITKTVEDFKNVLKNTLAGFHRMSYINAAVLLAKIHGVEIDQKFRVLNTKFLSLKGIRRNRVYDFAPQAFPLHLFQQHLSTDVVKCIEHCEKLPEINHKPFFDNFVVLAPGFQPITGAAVSSNVIVNAVINKQVAAVILGEREGKGYFISYF